METEIKEVESRLSKLYDALATGEFRSKQLTPRINMLFDKKNELEKSTKKLKESSKSHFIEITNPDVVKAYFEFLRGED